MKRLILGIGLLITGLSSNPIAAMDCEEAAEHWGYYDPEVAVAFGRQIRKVVRQKDLHGLSALITGKLDRGPRKRRFEEEMPTDTCQFFYECKSCKSLLKPLVGDCCVFCSYGSVPCPPIQQEKRCC